MFTAAGCHGHPAAHGLWNIAGLCPRLSSSSGCFPPLWEVTTRRTQTTSLPSKQLIPLSLWEFVSEAPFKNKVVSSVTESGLVRLLASAPACSRWAAFQANWPERMVVSSPLLQCPQCLTLLGCQRAPCYILAWLWMLWSISFKVCLAETAPCCLGSVLCRRSGHWLASCSGQLLPGLFWKVEIAESWPEVLR